MDRYLIDNNVIANFFAGIFSDAAMNFIAEVFDRTPIISVITEIEALSWISPDKNKEQVVKMFIEDASVISLTPEIVTSCIKIRRIRKIKTPDAIIAATAISHNLILITSDGDFKNIEGLRVINPSKIE
jgi:predicted nucleic acid-binding protein